MSRFERRSPIRKTKRLILIVGEGRETEPNYFEGLKREQAVIDRFRVSVRGARGGSALDVVHFAIDKIIEAKQARTPFDETFCVLDVESQEKKSTRHIKEAIGLAQKKDIKLIWSNPCFERWYLSHFERSTGAIRDCDALLVLLNKHWNKERGHDYEKNDSEVYTILRPKTNDAISNAAFALDKHHQNGHRILNANSATEVHTLVTFLFGRVSI